jgi:preprotein translocase subunit SecE
VAEDNEREDGQKRPSRPVTAAARRERRAAARPAARKDAASTETETNGEPATQAGPKGKAAEKVRKSRAEAAKAEPAAERKGRPTPTRDHKETGVGLFSRIMRFLREVVAELRKVIWPTRKQMITYTTVVLVFVAFMVALIAGMDVLLAKGVLWLFG